MGKIFFIIWLIVMLVSLILQMVFSTKEEKAKAIEELIIEFNYILIGIDWLILPAGIIWYNIFKQQQSGIMEIILISIVSYIIILLLCKFLQFVVSILYLIFIPLFLTIGKDKTSNVVLHCILFTAWATFVYWGTFYVEIFNKPPAYLILYSIITLPFVFYLKDNQHNINDNEIIYAYGLKVASFVSCILLLLLNNILITYSQTALIQKFAICFCSICFVITLFVNYLTKNKN